MAKEMLYMVGRDGQLTAMSPSAPRSEDYMQQLVGQYPELITDDDGDLLLVRREQPIADRLDSGGRWSLDHLFVTRSAVPVLVELKRASDTRLRREVVGQMLDYAANGSAYWRAGTIAEAFAVSARAAGRDPDAVLDAFLQGEDAGEFWRRVDDNFQAGRMKLVFVADSIPAELARIVEFLNEQMKADVRAVELRWFESIAAGVTTLSPRVIGETERTQAAKAAARGQLAPITTAEWIEKHIAPSGPESVAGAARFVELVESTAGSAEPASTQGSIVATYPTAGRPLYPLFLVRAGKGQVQLALGYLKPRSAFDSDEARQALYDHLTAIVGPLTTRTLNGFPAFPVIVLNEPAKFEAVRQFLVDLVAAGRAT